MAVKFKKGSSRVFTIKHRAGPTHEPEYLDLGAADAISWGQGDVTKIEAPSDIQYNRWVVTDTYQVSPDLATTTLHVYLQDDRSAFYELVRLRCQFDVQVHMGQCEDPRDFNGGWRKILVIENAKATSYDTSEIGALMGDN